MKFQVGDKVLVLHSNEEGEIVDIINDKMVMVDIRGVRFPAYIDQLDFPYFKKFTEKKLFSDNKQKKYIDQLPVEKKGGGIKGSKGVWLSFLPLFEADEFGDDVVETLKVHLVNNTTTAYEFTYHLNYFGKGEFELKNEVFSHHDFYLHDIPFADLNDNPVFEFDFNLLSPDKKKADHFESSLRLKPKQVFNRIEEIKRKGEALFAYKLFEEYPDSFFEEKVDISHLSRSGNRIFDVSRAREHLEPAKNEIDLHIEKLSDNWKSLSNFEILSIQLQTFEKYIDLALAHRQPSLIVIHGVGSGKLRDEIHELLRLKKGVRSFINQYDPRYGYGATEILLQY